MTEASDGKSARKSEKKCEVHTFDVDGVAVELREVPFRRHEWGHNHDADGNVIGHPREQKLYEAFIDGQLVARVAKPHGFGKQAYTLERAGFPRNEHYFQGLGYAEYHGAGVRKENKLYALDQVATRLVEERRKITGQRGQSVSSLPTAEEFAAYKAAVEQAEAAEEEEAKLSRDKFRRENNERIMREEQSRVDTLGGLHEVLDAFDQQLTNYQRDALLRAIGISSTPSGEYTQTMLRKREKELDDEMRANKDI